MAARALSTGAPTSPSMSQGQRAAGEATDTKSERDALDKASLVFVRNNTASATAPRPQESSPPIDLGISLAPGTRLRASFESCVSTAVQTPVVAVIEYNYEQNGEIVVPAGAKAFGRIAVLSADFGYQICRFGQSVISDHNQIGTASEVR